MRHTLGDVIESREWIFDPRLVGDGDDMKQSIGGPAHRDVQCHRVVDCVGGDDVAEANALIEKLEELVRGGSGELVPLTTSNDAVAAYLRRAGDRLVLVVVNLGNDPIANVSLALPQSALVPGQYAATPLLGGPAAALLTVVRDGQIRRYVPLRSVGARESYLFSLSPAR